MRLPTLLWFGCTNSTRLNPEPLAPRHAESDPSAHREDLEEKRSRSVYVLAVGRGLNCLLFFFLLQFKKKKINVLIMEEMTIFARFEVIIIVHTRFSSLVLKKRN